ncbi:M48 family metallopeptidase [Erythrobacter mangrovi]|uniref:M48 family metallopeptidase n=1 Tax=Erythrobacter mangrovi TaxID=2739433 RepID=A0A7D4BN35_9SPHN|nr:M48 family metallopeptidase [Erythrobacter mangrovi]QKG70804.1 M48 family metallopeptidase [Erythrobacter mangrovi]
MDESFSVPASWYDGHNALRHHGTARWDGRDTLYLEAATSRLDVPLTELRFGEVRGESRTYRRAGEDGFRLTLPIDMPAGLAVRLPGKSEYGAWIDRLGLGRAAAIFAVASAAAVTLFLTAPDWLGPRVPESWERKIGEAMVGDLGGRICHTPAGDAALNKLLAKVDPGAVKVRAGVANIDMINAVALPGGQVLLFDGIIQQAESPEELAGVLGHEVGHVRERHVMTALLRQFGLSVLLAGANSGVGNTAAGIASMGYSRDAEREADAYARSSMASSHVSPVATAGFFERMAERSGEGKEDNAVIGWLASHPAALERAKAFRAAAKKGADYRPVLSDREFAALKSMCKDDKDVEPFDLF